ncbi:MAG: SH3 domain-containing protein, partial [Chloroflexi bacterium]|nr:SH3 domain-containing protein [Chloroflexota bacterium]
MKHPRRRSAWLALTIGPAAILIALAAWPGAAVAGDTARPLPAPVDLPSADAQAPGVQPSIQYEEAAAHAADVIDFTPGERVDVGFTPRVNDTWAVGGGRPRALPAGQASGREMRAARQGSIWTLDRPAGPQPSPDNGAGSNVGAPIDGATGPSARATTAVSRSGDATATGTPALDATISPSGLRREVFGFLPYWELPDSSTTLRWDVLSTIAYFSVGTDASGNLLKQDPDGSSSTGWGGWTSSKMTSVITAAHQNGSRVVLTITSFAWTSGQQATQSALLGSPTARANLARQAAAAVRDRGADGINLDFEPIASGYAEEFTALVRSVRSELDAIAPGYQLTFDTTGYIGNYPLEAATAPGGADAIFIMGYDYRGTSSSQAGSISPLAGPVYDLTDTVNAYMARVSPSKLILGVPYYGRAWSTDTDALRATNISGTQYGTSVTTLYETAVDLAAQYGRRYDSVEQAPWTAYQKQTCTTTYGCVTAWRELYFDDAASLKLRYDLINRTGLRGAGIWALGYDGTRPELYQALADKFLLDTTPPVVGIIALAPVQRNLGFSVAWTGRDDSTIAGYDVQVAADGGAWTDWQTDTTATSAVFMGVDGRSYAFRARGRDSKGNISAWDVTSTSTAAPLAVGGFGTVQVDGLKLRAAAGTSAAILGTLNSGDVVAFTGGPASADGYTWYQVTAPVRQWSPVDPVQVGSWVAVGSATETYVTARVPINATSVAAVIRDYRVGDSSGLRIVTPNDPLPSSVAVSWTNAAALSELQLSVIRPDGGLVDARSIDRLAVGPQSIDWDGRVNGAALPSGVYLLQLTGRSGGVAVAAPSAAPMSPEIAALASVTVDARPGSTYVALPPTRLLDSRSGNGLSGAFGANVPRSFVVAGRGGVPTNAV